MYFVAKGVLTDGEENQNGEVAVLGEENLYLYAEGHVTFIAGLAASARENEQWQDSLKDEHDRECVA